MPFAFLHPWFFLGALAVAAPLWLHLRRKHQTDVQAFTALRFLEDSPPASRSPLRIWNIVLFLLRVLCLCLLVTAFAWPYRAGPQPLELRESRVYILDNTLSHQANEGFARDRERILSDLSRLGRDMQIAVVELTAQPRVIVSFGDDRETAKQKLKGVSASHQRGSFLAAFRQANALLKNSLGHYRRIVFLSDNQENQWAENLNTPPFLDDIQVDLAPVASLSAPSLSVAEPRVQRIFLGDKSLVNFTAKLSHQSEAKAAKVFLSANGKTIFQRDVPFEQVTETILLQAQWETDPNQWLRGEVSVEGAPDALAGDNRAYFSLAPLHEAKVVLLAQSPYLRIALSPDVMRGHWAARVLDPARLAEELTNRQDAEVLILESNYLQSSEARQLLWRYVSNGRGVVLLVNRLTPVINGALREMGFEAASETPISAQKPEKIEYVFGNHPIFHPFLSADYGNLLEVKVLKHYSLKATQGLPLVISNTGDVLFYQSTKGPGKLYVAAFGMETEQTSWPLDLTFIPFLDLCLQNACPEDSAPVNCEPGEVSLVQLAADCGVKELILRDDKHELLRAPVVEHRAQLRMPDEPGLYTVTCDATPEPFKLLAVNPSLKESNLNYIGSPEAMKIWPVPRSRAAVAPVVASATSAGPSRAWILRQQWWWWLLLVAVGGLLLETLWASARKERS